MSYYETVTQALSELAKRGYTHNFNLSGSYLSATGHEANLSPDDFDIDEVHRFEGDTDPGDEMVVYAISSGPRGIKGVLVNAYGPYADQASDALMAKLREKH